MRKASFTRRRSAQTRGRREYAERVGPHRNFSGVAVLAGCLDVHSIRSKLVDHALAYVRQLLRAGGAIIQRLGIWQLWRCVLFYWHGS